MVSSVLLVLLALVKPRKGMRIQSSSISRAVRAAEWLHEKPGLKSRRCINPV